MADLERPLYVRADGPLFAALDRVVGKERARGHRRSRADLVRRLLIEGLERMGEKVEGVESAA